jgi:hypothetical protein
MKRIEIEWCHLDKEGNTCKRCEETGEAVKSVVDEFSRERHASGWEIVFKETLLMENEISESNLILINGDPIEDLLSNARKSENCCDSCCEMLGQTIMCRTIERDGRAYEAIPAVMISEAVKQYIDQHQS